MRGFMKILVAGLIAGLALQGAGTAVAADSDKVTELTKGLTKKEGLFKLWHSEQKMLAQLSTSQMNKDYIVLTSIARGISSGRVLGGMSWGFGDDIIWRFRKVGEKIHVVRRNVRYKAKAGSPAADAVKIAYSDSVLYALPILDSSNGYLVDVTRIFMSDDQGIGSAIGAGFRFSADRSTWAKVTAYPKNVEIQVAAVYSGNGYLETIPDVRGTQVNVHYSISELPTSGYKPRAADDRVGYFLTVTKDFSREADDQYVRYINRWRLEKADPKAKLSPPKEPIIFYMEKTVPIALRPYVQAGIEEWNKAFEEIGFSNAIQVRQQRDDDTWDPEDIRYNTFRWITADAGFAMGPSRVNPLTGEILDADIIFDASFLKFWREDYETMSKEHLDHLLGKAEAKEEQATGTLFGPNPFAPGGSRYKGDHDASCKLCKGMNHQMSLSAAALMLKAEEAKDDNGKLPDEFIHQALKEVVMHEVGHTLGLRHNFKASAWKTLAEINDPDADPDEPTVASVMDYTPANIALPGEKQGLYYTQTVGPYDRWAIKYGYSQHDAAKEKAALEAIASQGAKDGLDYATDEDTRSSDSDPFSNRFDLASDPLVFVERQMKLSMTLLPKIVERSVEDGENYTKARQAFGVLLGEYWRAVGYAARFPGGVEVRRDHKGDENARIPFKVADAKQQRKAMELILNGAFASPEISPQMLNSLGATRWDHWGMPDYTRIDYPVHDVISRLQSRVLSQIMSTTTLDRLLDNEKKVAADADAYTLAEHMDAIVKGVFSEWSAEAEPKADGDKKPAKYTNRNPRIDSYRRGLQRLTLARLASLVLPSSAPDDARTLARMHLQELDQKITKLLEADGANLDAYTKAHLLDSQVRIKQVLNSELTIDSVR